MEGWVLLRCSIKHWLAHEGDHGKHLSFPSRTYSWQAFIYSSTRHIRRNRRRCTDRSNVNGCDLDFFWQLPLTGLDSLLSWTAGLSCIFGTASGSLKQIPLVACMEAVAAGCPTAGLDVRGGFITDTGAGVKLLESTEGKEASGSSRSCTSLSFGWNSSTLGDQIMPCFSLVSSNISCSARKASSKASSAWSFAATTKGLMSRTIAVHVRYKSLYISLPSSAKQREMTKLCGVHETRTTPANFSCFHLELNAVARF